MSEITMDTLKRVIIKPKWNDGVYEYLKFFRIRYYKGSFIIPSNMDKLKEILKALVNQYKYSLSAGVSRLYKSLPEVVIQDLVPFTSDTKGIDYKVKLELREYQKIGVNFLEVNKGIGLIADEQGTGKTCQTITYLYKNNLTALVICPCSVRNVWVDEIKKFTGQDSYIITTKDKNVKIVVSKGLRYYITNYDIITKIEKLIPKLNLDVIVLDESHFIKNYTASRTKSAHRLRKFFSKRILLSGTPLTQCTMDFYSQLRFLNPKLCGTRMEFGFKFCGAFRSPWGWQFKGSSNIPELKRLVHSVMLRRMKSDVLKEIPEKVTQTIRVDLSTKTKKAYNLAVNDFSNYLSSNKGYSKKQIDRSLQAKAMVLIGELKQLVIDDKIKALKELLSNNKEKIIIFCEYKSGIVKLKEMFGTEAVVLDGSTSLLDRKQAINRFQNDEKIRYFIGSSSAYTGITLTAASNVYFVALPWGSGDVEQASDRAHRIGQKKQVNIYFLLAGAIDEYVFNIIGTKGKNSKNILGDSQTKVTTASFMKFMKG